MAELINVCLATRNGGKRDFAVAYVPPRTRPWKDNEYQEMLADTTRNLKNIMEESENLILMGDFNCKEVNWEDWNTDEGESSLGSKLLNLVMENTMTQWIQDETRF